MDGNNNNNRLFLNFGNNNERLAPADRTFPTTPSTFPQPVFQSTSQQPGGGLQSSSQQQPQHQQPQQPYSSGYGGSEYFMQNQYQPQYQNQPMSAFGGGQNAAYQQQRSVTPGTNDPNTGLAQQFSQLGGARSSPYGLPSSQRPRTAGTPGPSGGYGYMGTPMSSTSPAPVSEFQQAPERNPDKYGPNANNNQKRCAQLAADFFKDSVRRARERNQR
jgi:protein-serine/threonine kinase